MAFRIALLQLARTIGSSNGMTSFIENFILMNKELDVKVDIICNEDPFPRCVLPFDDVEYIYPDNPLSDKVDVKMRGLFTYNLSLETQINFRNAMYKALHSNSYDMILINSEDAIPAIYNMELKIPTYVYTHFTAFVYPQECQNTFLNLVYQTELYKDKFVFLTQSDVNVEELKGRGIASRTVPLPVHPDFLHNLDVEPNPNAEGLLFNGRNASEKRFGEFLETVQKLGCKAFIMTGSNSEKSMMKAIEESGIEYEFVRNVKGKDRINFMRKAKATFHPSKSESYGYAVYEAMHVHASIINEKYSWTRAFKGTPIHFVNGDNKIEKIKEILESDIDFSSQFDKMKEMHAENVKYWCDLYDEVKEINKNQICRSSRFFNYLEEQRVTTIKDFIRDVIKRDMTFSDLDSLHRQIKTNEKIFVKQMKDKTLFSLDGNFEQSNENTLEDLF